MSVLDRPSLEQSPLADLHAIASELGLDGYRRLRKADLIDALLRHQSGEEPAGDEAPDTEEAPEDEAAAPKRRRGRRGGRARSAARDDADDEDEPVEAVEAEPSEREAPARRAVEEDVVVEGVVELLANGSGFIRLSPPEPSDDDVYISAAQAKRCELVAGDRISGPRRAPRRSERFPSLIRIDTINGRLASELAQSTRFDDLTATFPQERLALGSADPTIAAIEVLTPFGKGSRVAIVGPSRAGKTEALLRLAGALSGTDGIELLVALAGVRPEEVGEWKTRVEPAAAVTIAASADTQGAAVEQVIDQARRLVARGAHVAVLIDSLDGVPHGTARKALASARNVVDGGSLTVIATAATPVGGETTVIALDPVLASIGRFPALDLAHSGTIRPELLVGEAGAEAIARARAEALGM